MTYSHFEKFSDCSHKSQALNLCMYGSWLQFGSFHYLNRVDRVKSFKYFLWEFNGCFLQFFFVPGSNHGIFPGFHYEFVLGNVFIKYMHFCCALYLYERNPINEFSEFSFRIGIRRKWRIEFTLHIYTLDRLLESEK